MSLELARVMERMLPKFIDQMEAINLTLCDTNKILRGIDKLHDERNGALMQIKEVIQGIETTELVESLDGLKTAVNNIDLTT